MMDTAFFNPIIIKDCNLPWQRVAHLGSRVIFPQGAIVGGNIYEGAACFYLTPERNGAAFVPGSQRAGKSVVLCREKFLF